MKYKRKIKRGAKTESGAIALLPTIIISLVLLVMAAEVGAAGWRTRFTILDTEAKEEANALAEGCADQALARIITDPLFAGDATTTSEAGDCYVFPLEFDTPSAHQVTIRTQAQIREAYANFETVADLDDIHIGTSPLPAHSPPSANLKVKIISRREVPTLPATF